MPPEPSAPLTAKGMTPNEVSRLLRISPDRVRAMIVRGELGAINVSTRHDRPRFVVLPVHIEEFARRHRATTATKPAPRRRKQTVGVDFYPD
jgi:hypothetical protein